MDAARVPHSLGYTVEALTRLFRERYGVPPRRYVNGLRIRHACQLIERGGLPLKQVARECGFSGANYFGRVFRRFMGVTPGQYQRNPDPLRVQGEPVATSRSDSTPHPTP